ncbi:hypothetical protein BDN72DRAFT_626969 [Pluteus cervinus]|uniref:Uncharacterized protein n=1 Tax=Pluteus cervinus TaxID=181527 RepID=A0ACD3AUT5_9AGAR|nr:hypothetical protein BDN72DRAFT_626969 [Pluteus cervinus]
MFRTEVSEPNPISMGPDPDDQWTPAGASGAHINDLPNEILGSILKLVLPSTAASVAEGIGVPSSLSTCRRWRALVVKCVLEVPFTASLVREWDMEILGSWADREYRENPFQFPKLILQIANGSRPRYSSEPSRARSGPPPFQIAFQVLEELEIHFPGSYLLDNNFVNSPLKFLKVNGKLFDNLHSVAFPHLTGLVVDGAGISPERLASILLCMPILKELSVVLIGHARDRSHPRIFKSTSLISLSISFLGVQPWPIVASFPNLETFISSSKRPFEKALPFIVPSLRTMVAYGHWTCADRHPELFTFLEKCPQLEKLAIPTEFLLLSPFFDKLSSGAIVPNLKELRCGPAFISADILVGFLRKKGFVDAPQTVSKSDLVSPTPVCPFSCLSFCGISKTPRKEIEERLGGVTHVVEFVAHERVRRGRGF